MTTWQRIPRITWTFNDPTFPVDLYASFFAIG
jgi:hypothetical protein